MSRAGLKVAKLMESGKQWWIADEFCSTLDQNTAKIVAFNVQKLTRQNGKAVIVATTHTDLFEDLKPSVHVHKKFGRGLEVSYYPNKLNRRCSLVKEMRVKEGSIEDYRKLSVFHYRNSHRPAPRFKIKMRNLCLNLNFYIGVCMVDFD